MTRKLLAALAFAAAGAASAQGVTDSTILLGQSVALTGPAQQLGLDMRLGASLYFDQVNLRGGVNGRKIVLKTLDDGYEATRAAENTKKLINDERVFALFGYVGTPTAQASLPIFTEAKVPFVGPFTGAELLRTPVNPYIFNVRASYWDETEAIVQHLTAMSVNKIAVFYQNDAYGLAGLTGVERALKKRGLEIVARGTVERSTGEVK
jgi:branched-chain amino acid transport system substrate-binding protein